MTMVNTGEIMGRLRKIASAKDHDNYDVNDVRDEYVGVDGYFDAEMLRELADWLEAQKTD